MSCSSNQAAKSNAFALCFSTRKDRVSSPFNNTQALNAESVGPVLRLKVKTLEISSSEPSTAPPKTRP